MVEVNQQKGQGCAFAPCLLEVCDQAFVEVAAVLHPRKAIDGGNLAELGIGVGQFVHGALQVAGAFDDALFKVLLGIALDAQCTFLLSGCLGLVVEGSSLCPEGKIALVTHARSQAEGKQQYEDGNPDVDGVSGDDRSRAVADLVEDQQEGTDAERQPARCKVPTAEPVLADSANGCVGHQQQTDKQQAQQGVAGPGVVDPPL